MRVVTYARVSTRGQVEKGYSLAEQRDRLVSYVADQGWTHVEHLEDSGVSGKFAK